MKISSLFLWKALPFTHSLLLEWRARRAADKFLRANDSAEIDESLDEYFDFIEDDPENARAARQLNKAWDAIGQIPDLPWPRLAEVEPQRRAYVRPSFQFAEFAASIAVVAAVVAIFLFDTPGTAPDQTLAFATEQGRQDPVELEDGSVVTLGGATSVLVDYSARQRRLTLVEGEAFVEVVPEPEREFTVLADGLSVTAIGTAFNVNKMSDAVFVSVSEGRVRLNWRDGDAIMLSAGEQISFLPGLGVFTPKGSVAIDQVAPWRRGELVFEDRTLSHAVEAINRYYDGEILIQDERVGDLRASGVTNTGSPVEWLESLGAILPVELQPIADEHYLLSYREE